MYIWCKYTPLNEDSNMISAMGLLLDLGFDPRSLLEFMMGFKHICQTLPTNNRNV